MKPTGSIHRLIFIGLFLLSLSYSCEDADETGPGDCWCTSGINVMVVDDSAVPDSAREMIYSVPEGYRAMGTPDYSAGKKLIIIRYEFATQYPRNPNVTPDLVREDFFSTGTRSVREYFRENSYGQFDIVEGAIPDWVTLSYDSAHYADLAPHHDWPSSHELHQELCQKAQVDWSAFDANGDHFISHKEAQICFLSSVGQGGCCRYSDFVIATNFGEYQIAHAFALFDSKKANAADSHVDAIAYNYGTIWHELCHAIFGLPDRYKDYCGSGTTGNYDIMSDPCREQKMNMFDKMKLGWVKPRILDGEVAFRPDGERHCYHFPSSENDPAALVLLDRDRMDQYWVVENRYTPDSPRGFDSELPESGLFVWWVDATTNKVYLVDAHNPMKHPQTIMYEAGLYLGACFKGDTCDGDAIYTTYLSSSSGDLSVLVRAVSPPGPDMYIEF